MRMVESSMNSASAIAAKDQPRSSSRMAFARRETRFSSRPSLAIATRSARSAALRKLRFVFTRRVESIPLIRSTDFRKNEESRYKLLGRSQEAIADLTTYDRLEPGDQEVALALAELGSSGPSTSQGAPSDQSFPQPGNSAAL